MTRNNRIFVFLLAAFVTLAWLGFGQSTATAKDPVCGMSVNKDGAKFTYDYKGTTYYFCGQGCKDEFAKDPEKYLQPQTDTAKDPVCGMSVKKDGAKFTYDYKGTTYYFCGQGCKDEFAKNPEKYLQPQTDTAKDPVCGMSVKKEGAKFTSDYKGTTYYFCCENCKAKFVQDPEKYLSKKDASAGGPMVKGDEGGCCAGGCACKKPIKK